MANQKEPQNIHQNPIQLFESFMSSNKQETQDNTPEMDKDLETIRYYHGNWKNFFDYWKKRGVKPDPYKDVELIHPNKKIQKESTLPYQDFGTYDRSKMNKITESFEEFIKNEKNINEEEN